MTNIKPIQQEDEAAIRQDAQDMQDGRCARRLQPERQRRTEMLLENKNAVIYGAGGMVGGNKCRESIGGEDG